LIEAGKKVIVTVTCHLYSSPSFVTSAFLRRGLAHEQQHECYAYDDAESRLLPVPLVRLPHQEPFRAHRHEPEEIKHEADRQSGDSPAAGAVEVCCSCREPRGQAERAVSEVATLLSRTQTELKNPELARLNAKVLRTSRNTAAAAEKMLQEARTALKAEEYAAVTKALNGAATELQAALTEIDAATSPKPAARKR